MSPAEPRVSSSTRVSPILSVLMPGSFSPAIRTVGDVKARFDVRVEEAWTSLSLVGGFTQQAGTLDAATVPARAQAGQSASGVGITEAWRGAAVHRVELDDEGRLTRVKVVDPSFHNWPALPVSWPTRSFPTSPWPTRASVSPTPGTTSDARSCVPRIALRCSQGAVLDGFRLSNWLGICSMLSAEFAFVAVSQFRTGSKSSEARCVL